MKLSSWPEIGSDGDVLWTPYVSKGITGYDDDDDMLSGVCGNAIGLGTVLQAVRSQWCHWNFVYKILLAALWPWG